MSKPDPIMSELIQLRGENEKLRHTVEKLTRALIDINDQTHQVLLDTETGL